MLMRILSGNLTEGQTKDVEVSTKSSTQVARQESQLSEALNVRTSTTTADISPSVHKEINNEKAQIFLKFTFAMEQLTISLFTGGSKEVSFFIQFQITS